MKNRNLIISLIIFLTIMVVLLASFLIVVLKNDGKMSLFDYNDKVSDELVINETYDNNFDEIAISANKGDIIVRESQDDKIKVKVYSKKDKASVMINENILKINVNQQKCVGICFSYKMAKIEVYLPSNYREKITIANNYGDVKIGNFKEATLNISEDSGDIEIDSAYSVTAKLDAGDIEISRVNYVDIKNSYGDIEIDYVLNYMNVENNCGDVEIDNINIDKFSMIKSDLGDVKLGNTNDVFIDAKTGLGNVHINNNNRMSDVILKIKNDCGDIKVNN